MSDSETGLGGTLGLAGVLEAEQNRFMRFLIARTRNQDLVQDLFQDARTKLLKSDGGKPVSNSVPYIFQMLANLVEDHRRSERAREQRARD